MARKSAKTNTPKPETSVSQSKFVLYNFAGEAKGYYLVDRQPFQPAKLDSAKPGIAHSIVIIDRSGSMYSDLGSLKDNLLKLLTLDEYTNSNLLITLISYSSRGDATCHFQRVPIQEVMKPESVYQQNIRAIQVTGATCISQSMEIAKTLIKEHNKPGQTEELTAITLHTDGYANDPSYNDEVRKLDAVCEELKGMNVFVNTISYSYADFKLLSKIANSVSGTCIKAGNIKEVYDALYQTSTLLSNSVTPAIEEPLIKGYDYQVFVSQTARKINGSANTLKIMGLKPEDQGTFYKYKKITQAEYEKLSDVATLQTDVSVLAFVKANLAEGNINTAKYALVSTLDQTLTEKHAKALTNSEIAEFTLDIEQVIFNPSLLSSHTVVDKVQVSDKITILELLELLYENRKGIIINLKDLQKNYQRKGLKRIRGSRDESGQLVEPWLKTETIDGGEYVKMGKFDVNRNTATINMLISRPVKLVKVEDETQISEVAGILVDDLTQFNNYTIVSDGEVNVKALKVKINNRQVFETLKAKGLLAKDGKLAEEFDFSCEYDINLGDLPLVSFGFKGGDIDGVFIDLAKIKTLSSIIAAHIKEESDNFTSEQLEELKKHYLSKSLYINFPTTTEYTDLQEALNNGTVDSRVSYKIDIGSGEILNLSKLYSANAFLDRLYEVTVKESGEKLTKPTFEQTLNQEVTYGHKTLSSRTKITKVDELMRQIFDNFLGLEDNGSVTEILNQVGAESLIRVLQAKWKNEAVTKTEFITALTQAKYKLEDYAEKIYGDKISPLVFYIGSTGLLPDEIEAKAMTADEISSKYPELKISKSEAEGTFFEVGNTIITVYTQNEYFSVEKKDYKE